MHVEALKVYSLIKYLLQRHEPEHEAEGNSYAVGINSVPTFKSRNILFGNN